MAIEVLLIEDVLDLGRSGEVHRVAPGFARNFLLPQGFAVIADRNTLRKQARLKEERERRAQTDRTESEKLAHSLEGVVLGCTVKVDPNGHMYGSVSTADVVKLFEERGFSVEKRFIHLQHPIKTTGVHVIPLRLKEGVTCECKLKVLTEEQQGQEQE
jgi:large subunit ribosomal protein L9